MRKTQLVSCLIVANLFIANQLARAADTAPPDRPMIPPAEAISRLKEGNGRFIAGNPQHPHESSDERAYIAKTAIKMLAQFLWA